MTHGVNNNRLTNFVISIISSVCKRNILILSIVLRELAGHALDAEGDDQVKQHNYTHGDHPVGDVFIVVQRVGRLEGLVELGQHFLAISRQQG